MAMQVHQAGLQRLPASTLPNQYQSRSSPPVCQPSAALTLYNNCQTHPTVSPLNSILSILPIKSQYQFNLMSDKKLVALFRGFVEKVFLPALPKGHPALNEWGRFSQLLTLDNNAYEEAAQYVEAIGANNSPPSFALDKRDVPLFKKRAQEAESLNNDGGNGGFNPSKTFGGERARMMFMKGDMEDFSQPRQGGFGFTPARSEPRAQSATSPQAILPGLERLCKTFLENQGRIENLLSGKAVGGKYG